MLNATERTAAMAALEKEFAEVLANRKEVEPNVYLYKVEGQVVLSAAEALSVLQAKYMLEDCRKIDTSAIKEKAQAAYSHAKKATANSMGRFGTWLTEQADKIVQG